MIKFYLTGGTAPNQYQVKPEKSLGGYPSLVEVINGNINSLFGRVSEFSKTNRQNDHVMIACTNTGAPLSAVSFIVSNDEASISVVDLSIVNPSMDNNNKIVFETIANKNAIPYYAEFDEGEGVSIPSLATGATVGIWLRRIIKDEAYLVPTKDQLNAIFEAGQTETVDTAILTVNY